VTKNFTGDCTCMSSGVTASCRTFQLSQFCCLSVFHVSQAHGDGFFFTTDIIFGNRYTGFIGEAKSFGGTMSVDD
jgi:hypothetical protein